MSRSDIPYALLTLVFGVAIFFAGRMSAPEATQTIIRETVQTAPSVIIVPSAAPQAAPIPYALLPEVPEAPKVAPTASQVPVRTPKLSDVPIKTTPKTVPSVHVELEETPDVPSNPYKP